MGYHYWIPLCLLLYGAMAYFMRRNELAPSKGYSTIIAILCCLPLWSFVAPGSKDLAFDGLFYDTIMICTMTGVMVIMGADNSFSKLNRLGALAAICGFILMKS